MYYANLVLTIGLVILSAKKPGSATYITGALSLFCLIADLGIAMLGNMPINIQINQYFLQSGVNLENVRNSWLTLISYRAVICSLGFVSLLWELL